MSSSDNISAAALGAWVRDKRKSLKWSTQKLSDESGVSYGYVNQIELGKEYPRRSIITKLANALGENPADALIIAGYIGDADFNEQEYLSKLRRVSVEQREILKLLLDHFLQSRPDNTNDAPQN